MITPQARLNLARLRRERRIRAAATLSSFALAAAIALAAITAGHGALTLARTLPDLLEQAAALKGM